MPDEAAVVAVLKSIPGYAPMFAAAFPADDDPITYDHMAEAIGAFERLLVTPGPFDDYLAGNGNALSAEARDGLALFLDKGCASCHMGPAVGGRRSAVGGGANKAAMIRTAIAAGFFAIFRLLMNRQV